MNPKPRLVIRLTHAVLLIALALAGCATMQLAPSPQPAPTHTPEPTGTVYLPAVMRTPAGATATPLPATPTSTSQPASTATPVPTSTATATPEPQTQAERVLVISVDGLRPDALSDDVSPHIMALARAGAYSWGAQTVLPSVTLVSHASMLSGVPPAQHGITWNSFRPLAGTIRVPTVFSIADTAGLRTAMLFGKTKLLHLAGPGAVDEVLNLAGQGDAIISRRAAEMMAEDFGVMFIHLPGVDGAGHAQGWMSPGYLAAVTTADEAIGRILGGLDAAGMAETTTVIVTADHGGSGTSHGRDTPEDRTIPWVIAGPGIRSDHELGVDVSVMDTAATAVFALGLEAPESWEGRPVTEAFVVN